MDHLLKRPQACGIGSRSELYLSGVSKDPKEIMEKEEEVKSRERVNREKWVQPNCSIVVANQAVNSVASVLRAYSFFEVYIYQLSLLLLTLIVAVLACSLRGDMMLFAHLIYKTIAVSFYHQDNESHAHPNHHHLTNTSTHAKEHILPGYLQLPDSYNLPDLLLDVFLSILTSELTYHSICGFLQIYFYVLRRGEPEKWKCQPHRFLTRSNEFHEIVVGTSNMFFAGALSGVLTCWIKSGNYNRLYYKLDEYGYPYLLFSIVALFLWLEATAYYIHAMLHIPWFYKTLHKHHHRYHSPTAYSAVSMSPIELSFLNLAVVAPLFMLPLNATVFVAEVAYIYYFGLMDHSGVMMDSWFPWQPHTKFHDDHHRYFHCNFGFNTYLFDYLHGTLRKENRIYGEGVFGGKGKEKKSL